MATKLPSGTYRTQVLIDSSTRKYKSFTGKTADEADVKAKIWKLSYLRNAETSASFYNASGKYIEASENILAPYTLRSYKTIRKMLREKYNGFTRRQLRDITKADLQGLYGSMIADGRKPKTIKNYHSFICSVFTFNDITVPKVKLPEVRQRDMYIPDEEELARLLSAVSGTRLELPVLLGMRGLRRGEICAAKASDLCGNVLHIQRSMTLKNNVYVETIPKTKSSDRLIPLPAELADRIREQGCVTDMTPHQLTKSFRNLVRRKRLGFAPFRFHDLRHAFVSIAHANNIPDAYIMSMGGWSTNYTMQHVYRHSLSAHMIEYQGQMENVFDRVSSQAAQ